ncbi:MAG: VTT domain-containing protein [Chloroflexi bacterium]|nr:VTT domain-containing protein [Chloroflexota bacterium]
MKVSHKVTVLVGTVFMVLTLLMAGAVIYFWEFVRGLQAYGYLGVLVISVLGGATIIIPVPMLAVVFALGGVMEHTWLVGVAAGVGETIGALTIYLTGYGGRAAFFKSRNGKIRAAYEKMMRLMAKRGSVTLFFLSAILNPFFYPAALAAGALQFGLRKYLLICWVGKTIKGMTIAYAGYWGLRNLMRLFGVDI